LAYDKDLNYQQLINEAVAKGDMSAAAKYEAARNEKIADMNKSGTNTGGWTQTNNYTSTTPASSMPAGFTGSSNAVGVNTQNQAAIREQMNANSMAWHTADEPTKRLLEEANKDLGAQLGGTVSFDRNTGYWSGQAQQLMQPTFSYDMDSKPSYESEYKAQIDAMLNEILNREDFSYNAEKDPLFQQYQQMYQREGNRAMNDTLAEVASGAGGMNSYAITAAQQANDYYNAQMTDKIPELYQLAYDMYLQGIDNKVRDLGLLTSMDDTQYGRYRDTMSDWYNDRDFAYNQYRDQMGDYWTEKDFETESGRYDKEWDYMEKQDAYERAMDMIAMGVTPGADLMAQAGLSASEVTAAIANQQKTSTGSSSSSGGGNKAQPTSGKWDAVVDWVNRYGEEAAEDYIKENYKKLGYTSQSAALSGWKNYQLENGEYGGDIEVDLSPLGDSSITAEIAMQLVEAGGAEEKSNGQVVWKNGWNASNYKRKLAEMNDSYGDGR
jgi:hypothetical protein